MPRSWGHVESLPVCRVPGKLDPMGPFPVKVTQNKALQAEWGGRLLGTGPSV